MHEHYKAIFFTEKKKRYAGITEDGTIVVRGLEVRRGDWCALAKELQSDVIKIILERREPGAAAELVTSTIKRLRAGKIPLTKLIIYKTLTKKISSYESVQAHVRAAKRAKEYGLAADVGAKVAYLVMKGTGSIGDRSYPAEIFKQKEGKLVDTLRTRARDRRRILRQASNSARRRKDSELLRLRRFRARGTTVPKHSWSFLTSCEKSNLVIGCCQPALHYKVTHVQS